MLVNIPAPWSIWDYVIQSVHQCPTVCVTEKSSKTVRSRWVPLHRAMVASPWWEGRNSQGSQTGISSTNLSLPNKILNLKTCMPFFFEQLGFESVSRYVRWSKLCLGMRLQAKSGPICSVASMQMGEAWLSKARTISTRDPSPEGVLSNLVAEHLGLISGVAISVGWWPFPTGTHENCRLAGRNPSSRAAYNFRPFVCLSSIVWPVFILRACAWAELHWYKTKFCIRLSVGLRPLWIWPTSETRHANQHPCVSRHNHLGTRN